MESKLSVAGIRNRIFSIDSAAALTLFSVNLLLIAPYLSLNLSSQPWNNDYAYMAMIRMFHDHSWTWNSLQYGGAPFTYVYPPLFHALVAVLPVNSLGRAYHLTSGFGYALIPVALYILSLQLFRSRAISALAALAHSFFPSPSGFLLPTLHQLAQPFHQAPWSFIALNGYAEVPHLFSVSFTLMAVAAAWRGLNKLASLFAAAVFLTSWPGLLGLLMALVPVAIAQTRSAGFTTALRKFIATAGTAYGLTAFWMTPGFFFASIMMSRVVLRHEGGTHPWTWATWIIVAAAGVLLTLALWRRVPAVAALILSWTAITGVVVATFTLSGNELLPLPHRYVMEFNLCLVLLIAGAISICGKYRLGMAAVVLLCGAFASRDFVSTAWALQPISMNQSQMLSFQIAEWLGTNASSSRVLVAGELDGSLNFWKPVAQVGGTRQGVSNFLFMAAQRQVIFGCGEASRQASIAELWLRALDARFVVVHDGNSREHFHWFVQPEEFAAFPVAWNNGGGDKIYRVPFLEDTQAVVVDLDALRKLPRLRSTDDAAALSAYVKWAMGRRPVRIDWRRTDAADLEIQEGLASNEGILVKVNYDRGWRTSSGNIEADPIGLLLIRPPAAHRRFHLFFGASPEVWLGRAITLMAILLLLAKVPAFWIGAGSILPAALTVIALVSSAPYQMATAEEAFVRLHPPIINPGGIVDGQTTEKPVFRKTTVVSVYGLDFGSKDQPVTVWIGDKSAKILYRSANLLNAEVPAGVTDDARVSVEVNGCRGNSFALWGGPGTVWSH